jgi:hypothetical protein
MGSWMRLLKANHLKGQGSWGGGGEWTVMAVEVSAEKREQHVSDSRRSNGCPLFSLRLSSSAWPDQLLNTFSREPISTTQATTLGGNSTTVLILRKMRAITPSRKTCPLATSRSEAIRPWCIPNLKAWPSELSKVEGKEH